MQYAGKIEVAGPLTSSGKADEGMSQLGLAKTTNKGEIYYPAVTSERGPFGKRGRQKGKAVKGRPLNY